MRQRLQYLTALVFLATIPASAQSILPDQFLGWNAGARSEVTQLPVYEGYRAGNEWFVDRSLTGVKEFGLVSSEQVSYARGTDSVRVLLYKMKDPSGAYGVYFYLRSPELRPLNLTEHSTISRERALLLNGNFVLDVQGDGLEQKVGDLKALLATVNSRAEHGGYPTLLQRMPQKGMIGGTDFYIIGPKVLYQLAPISQDDWLGFSQDTEAELAKYKVDGLEVTLVIADFPTPQLATAKLAELHQKFNVNGSNSDVAAQPLFAKRSLTLLAITLGARSQAEADALLNQVHTTTEITWNEPTFSLTEPSFPAMIVGVFVGTGVICLFAMISSVAFGGLRLAIKRLYPNKVFDRGSEIQILQLGLSSKPINAEDFYSINPPNVT